MTYYYKDFSEDFVETRNQAKSVPDNYVWIKKNPFYNLVGAILFCILKFVGRIYGHFALGLKIVGAEKITSYRHSLEVRNNSQKFAKIGRPANNAGGYYVFCNHTQALGDVFNPALYNPVHPYYVCDSSNLGIPILGPILPMVGALPIPESVRGKKRLFDAISDRARSGKAIIIYPEAHVWPYYTKIRPFSTTALHFPVRDNLPVFTATTTYQNWPHHKKPRAVIYIDGPFLPDIELDKKSRTEKLHDEVFDALEERSKLSTVEYIKYQKVIVDDADTKSGSRSKSADVDAAGKNTANKKS